MTRLFALVSLTLAAAPALAGPVGANVSRYITSSSKPPARPKWAGPAAALLASPIAQFDLPECGVNNRRALDNLVAFLRTNPSMEYPLAVVPGSSEAACHHCAWIRKADPHWVEPNFRSRLRHAFILLLEGVVHTVVISGGSIDPAHPEYNEAVFGARELISEYSAAFAKNVDHSGDKLEDRVIVDPWAIHSEVNVRNGDRLTRLLGLDRNLVVTEVGSIKRQGWYFVHHGAPLAFDHRAKNMFGFALGQFEETDGAPPLKHYLPRNQPDLNGVHPAQYTNSAGNHRELAYVQDGVDTSAIAHWGLRSYKELVDGTGGQRWDVAESEAASKDYKPLAPDRTKVGRSCATLGRH